jgi:energy-coupling factor transporter transmembrane protein EcfT
MRSFERGDRIYDAMSARGYDGEVHTFGRPVMSRQSRTALIFGLLLLAALLVLSRILG